MLWNKSAKIAIALPDNRSLFSSIARRQSGIPKTVQGQQFAEFQAWIEQKINVTYSQPWEKIIRFFSPDETASLQRLR